jgi:hypothetical protein
VNISMWPPWLVDRYALIDFSNIPRCPNELPKVDLDAIQSFMSIMIQSHYIFHV